MKEKYLIFHQGALGDFVLTFPALVRLKERATIDVCCQNHLGQLALSLGIADHSFPSESRRFASLFSDDIDPELRKFVANYNMIFLISFSSELENNIREITNVQVHRIPPRPPPQQQVHIAEYLLKHLDKIVPFKMTTPSLADLFLTIPKYYDSSGKVLLHPGSGSSRKNWPLENFIRLNILLKKRGMFTTWVLGPAEHFMVNELKKRGLGDKEVHLIHDLLDFLDLLKHAAGFIGNDSGLSHLSAFLGIPVISIFGPSDPKRWRPIGPLVKVVRSEIDCQPCFETENANCESSECLYSILPERVDAEIDSKFEYTSINRQFVILS